MPRHNTPFTHQLTDKRHTDFKVLAVKDLGGNKYEVKWSAKFGGVKYSDFLNLYAQDELEAFALASKVYGEK
jgi:hypothetical protein